MFYWVTLDEGIQDIIGIEGIIGTEGAEGSEQVEPLTLIPGAKKHELMEHEVMDYDQRNMN